MIVDEYGKEADERNQAKADAAFGEYCNDRDKGFDDGGAAYPIQCHRCEVKNDLYNCECGRADPGMTLLDVNAKTAMGSLVLRDGIQTEGGQYNFAGVAQMAYAQGKAMIEEKRRLEKEATP